MSKTEDEKKYKAVVHLLGGEKIYASEVEESEGTVHGRICNYDGSDGGEFKFDADYVKGIIRK